MVNAIFKAQGSGAGQNSGEAAIGANLQDYESETDKAPPPSPPPLPPAGAVLFADPFIPPTQPVN